MRSTRSCDVLVVGGGPAGLAAAREAAKRGLDVVLLEASATVGGMARSVEVAGVRVDLGSHRLHPSAAPQVRSLLDDLLGADLQRRQRDGRLRVADRWVQFPFRASDLRRTFPAPLLAAVALDAALAPMRRPRADTYAEVVRAGLGPTALARFHGPMARKLWGTDPVLLAGELARRRISVRTPTQLVRRVLRTSRPEGRVFLYPRLGFGEVVDRLAESAIGAGVDVRLNERVTSLRPAEATHDTVVTVASSEIHAGHVLWTAPLPSLAEVTTDGAAPAPRALLDAQLHRAVVLVYLVVAQPRWSPVDAHYVPDAGVAFTRLSEPKNYRDGPDPADRTVLCAELPCWVDDDVWRADPQDLRPLVLEGMLRCGLAVPSVDDVQVIRLPRVYPVLRADAGEARARALRWADSLDGVTVMGRQGRLVADNLHHVLDMGLAAGACVGAGGRWDTATWRAHEARFERFVVDD